MSIWTIEETPHSICFVEHRYRSYQSWDIMEQMADRRLPNPVQIPLIGCYDGYENCLGWFKK